MVFDLIKWDYELGDLEYHEYLQTVQQLLQNKIQETLVIGTGT